MRFGVEKFYCVKSEVRMISTGHHSFKQMTGVSACRDNVFAVVLVLAC